MHTDIDGLLERRARHFTMGGEVGGGGGGWRERGGKGCQKFHRPWSMVRGPRASMDHGAWTMDHGGPYSMVHGQFSLSCNSPLPLYYPMTVLLRFSVNVVIPTISL